MVFSYQFFPYMHSRQPYSRTSEIPQLGILLTDSPGTWQYQSISVSSWHLSRSMRDAFGVYSIQNPQLLRPASVLVGKASEFASTPRSGVLLESDTYASDRCAGPEGPASSPTVFS